MKRVPSVYAFGCPSRVFSVGASSSELTHVVPTTRVRSIGEVKQSLHSYGKFRQVLENFTSEREF